MATCVGRARTALRGRWRRRCGALAFAHRIANRSQRACRGTTRATTRYEAIDRFAVLRVGHCMHRFLWLFVLACGPSAGPAAPPPANATPAKTVLAPLLDHGTLIVRGLATIGAT